MPYIHVSLSEKLSETQEEELAQSLSRQIEIIPGKTSDRLMLRIDSAQSMYYQAKAGNCAYVNVAMFLMAADDNKAELGRAITDSIATLCGIASSNIYISFTECGNWCSGGRYK